MIPRLQEKYKDEILPALGNELGIQNPMALPKLEKIGQKLSGRKDNTNFLNKRLMRFPRLRARSQSLRLHANPLQDFVSVKV